MATFIPDDKITEIKNAVDIVNVISEIVLLKKAGKNYVGLCPFHSEKTPSFTVSPEKQIFYCFGCGIGGNIFSFLMKKDGISFPEAARVLASRYGINIPAKNMSSGQKKLISEKESLYTTNKCAMDFFCRILSDSPDGKKAMGYLKKRGITKEIIKGFNLGYAPEGWDNLSSFFLKNGTSAALAIKAGLISPRKSLNGFYDRFRGRIMFPIFNESIKVIGFGGRIIDDSHPKYLNSPETPVYNKSRSLYGLYKAKKSCRENNAVYIVEGYFDLLSLYQHGIENVVATLGTALTHEHVRIIRGLVGKAGKVVLVYDSDDAGIKAAQRSIGVFDRGYVDAQILVLPKGYDPDLFIFKFGPEFFLKTAKKASSIPQFLINFAINKYGLSIEGKANIISELKEPLSAISDKIVRSLYIKELAERMGIDEDALLEKVRMALSVNKCNNYGGIQHSYKTEGSQTGKDEALRTRGNRMERRIIEMMLQFPEILSEINKRNLIDNFEDDVLKSIGEIVLKHNDSSGGKAPELMVLIDDKDKRSMIASLAIGDDVWEREGCLKLIAQFEFSRNRHEDSDKDTLLGRIKKAEERNDNGLLLELLKEKQIQAGKRQLIT